MNQPRLSIVVIEFNMAREIARTILSLSPIVQRDIGADDYEIILVDNGSSQPSNHAALLECGANLTLRRLDNAGPSPVRAINIGLSLARGHLVGVMIDGARMASPGLLSSALQASHLYERGVISPLGFHLGRGPQTEAAQNGYDQEAEDALLTSSDWIRDGYNLYDIAVIAPGQAGGWFRPLNESTALFMAKPMWDELNGFDERFSAPGGGLANMDAYIRACHLPNAQPVMLLGEATFHQIHGGIASNAPPGKHPWEQFHKEYIAIRGAPLETPRYEPICIGRVTQSAMKFIEPSIR